MVNTDAEILKGWPDIFVARQVELFCVEQQLVADYSDQRTLLTAMAKHCVVKPLANPKVIPVGKVVRTYNACGNVLNCNVPTHITEHLVEVICNGKTRLD